MKSNARKSMQLSLNMLITLDIKEQIDINYLNIITYECL